MCECVWWLYPEAGRWGAGQARGTHGGRAVPPFLPRPLQPSCWAHVVPLWPRHAGGLIYLAPWGAGHMPRPTRAPLPLLSPEPPRFIKEPKDQIGVSGGVASFVCQATGDPKPRVTWNKKGKKVNSQRFEVSGQGREGRQPRAPPPHPRHGAMAAQPWKPSQEHSSTELAPSPSGTLLFVHHFPAGAGRHVLHEGSARLACSATCVLCGLK